MTIFDLPFIWWYAFWFVMLCKPVHKLPIKKHVTIATCNTMYNYTTKFFPRVAGSVKEWYASTHIYISHLYSTMFMCIKPFISMHLWGSIFVYIRGERKALFVWCYKWTWTMIFWCWLVKVIYYIFGLDRVDSLVMAVWLLLLFANTVKWNYEMTLFLKQLTDFVGETSVFYDVARFWYV